MPMRLEIITGERVLFQGDVESVVAPGSEGELGVLPHHAAVMTMLQPGELFYTIDGAATSFALTGGFMEIRGDPRCRTGGRPPSAWTRSTKHGLRRRSAAPANASPPG